MTTTGRDQSLAARVVVRVLDGTSTVAAASYGDGRIFTFTDRVLAEFDAATSKPRGEQVLLSQSASDENWFQANFRARPGHPDEVAVIGCGGVVTLWNPAQEPPQQRALPVRQGSEPYAIMFDATGRLLVGLSVDNTVEVRDVDTGALVHPPFPIPAAASPVGFDAEGHLLLTMRSADDDVSRLTFWDVATGRESASLTLSTAHVASTEVSEDGLTLSVEGVDGAVPFDLPLTAQQWFDRLCQLSDRPFTDAERAVLPSGASADPPCR